MISKPIYDLRVSRKETQTHSLVALNSQQRYYPLSGPYASDSTLNQIYENELLYELRGDVRPNEHVPLLQSVVTGRPLNHYTDVLWVPGIASFSNQTYRVERYKQERDDGQPGDAQLPQVSAVNIAPFVPGMNCTDGSIFKVGDPVWWCIPPPSMERQTLYLDNRFKPSHTCPAHANTLDHCLHEYYYRFFGFVVSTDGYLFEEVLVRHCPLVGRFMLPAFKFTTAGGWIHDYLQNTLIETDHNGREIYNLFQKSWFLGEETDFVRTYQNQFGQVRTHRRLMTDTQDEGAIIRAFKDKIDKPELPFVVVSPGNVLLRIPISSNVVVNDVVNSAAVVLIESSALAKDFVLLDSVLVKNLTSASVPSFYTYNDGASMDYQAAGVTEDGALEYYRHHVLEFNKNHVVIYSVDKALKECVNRTIGNQRPADAVYLLELLSRKERQQRSCSEVVNYVTIFHALVGDVRRQFLQIRLTVGPVEQAQIDGYLVIVGRNIALIDNLIANDVPQLDAAEGEVQRHFVDLDRLHGEMIQRKADHDRNTTPNRFGVVLTQRAAILTSLAMYGRSLGAYMDKRREFIAACTLFTERFRELATSWAPIGADLTDTLRQLSVLHLAPVVNNNAVVPFVRAVSEDTGMGLLMNRANGPRLELTWTVQRNESNHLYKDRTSGRHVLNIVSTVAQYTALKYPDKTLELQLVFCPRARVDSYVADVKLVHHVESKMRDKGCSHVFTQTYQYPNELEVTLGVEFGNSQNNNNI